MRIDEMLQHQQEYDHHQTANARGGSAAEFEETLLDYLQAYNHFIPQQAIRHY
jgi:hypothetical protein